MDKSRIASIDTITDSDNKKTQEQAFEALYECSENLCVTSADLYHTLERECGECLPKILRGAMCQLWWLPASIRYANYTVSPKLI